MATMVEPTPGPPVPRPRRRRSRWRIAGIVVVVLAGIVAIARIAMPTAIRWYVNGTLDRNQLYDGKIGEIEVHLWRGAYSIHDVRLIKTTGNVPVPLFAAKTVDLSIQWDALRHGKLVGRMFLDEPELNFVDDDNPGNKQTGAGGPWLEMIRDLFPFKVNSAAVRNGTVHFRAFHTSEPVDVYLGQVEGTCENLTNIYDETAPLISTVTATGLAMDQAKFDFAMKLDPFAYWPTFQLAARVVGLDVTQTNSLARSYGAFDFEHGYFDLVVELNAREGQLEGYVKPLFRDIQIFSLKGDVGEENVFEVFWEALVDLASHVFRNARRDQIGTVIPLTGDLTHPQTDFFTVIGNVLRNAFIRAYLPRLEGAAPDVDWIHFGHGSVTDEPSGD